MTTKASPPIAALRTAPKHHRFALAALAIAATFTSACAGNAGDEPSGQTEQHYFAWRNHSITDAQLQNKLLWLDLGGTTLNITNNHVAFAPSSTFSTLVYNDPNPANHALTFDFAPTHVSFAGGVVSGDVTVTWLVGDNFKIWVEGNQLLASIQVHGQANMSGTVSPEIYVGLSTLVLSFVPDGQGGLAFNGASSPDFTTSTTQCGWGGWCDGIVDDNRGLIESAVIGQFSSLAKTYVLPQVNQVWSGVLTADSNGGWAALAKPASQQIWSPSMQGQSISNGTIFYYAVANLPPPIPKGCTLARNCDGLYPVCAPSPVGYYAERIDDPNYPSYDLDSASPGPHKFEFCVDQYHCSAPITIDTSTIPMPTNCAGGWPPPPPNPAACSVVHPKPGCISGGGGGVNNAR